MPVKKYSKKLVDEMMKLREEGMLWKAVSKQVGISHETYRKWRRLKKEFGTRVDKANQILFSDTLTERLIELGRNKLETEGLSSAEIRARESDRRLEMDSLKFAIAQVNKQIIQRLEVKHSGEIDSKAAGITVINYTPDLGSSPEERSGYLIDLQPRVLKDEKNEKD